MVKISICAFISVFISGLTWWLQEACAENKCAPASWEVCSAKELCLQDAP